MSVPPGRRFIGNDSVAARMNFYKSGSATAVRSHTSYVVFFHGPVCFNVYA